MKTSRLYNIIQGDIIGIAATSLCVVHCLITPFLLVITTKYEWWGKLSYFFISLSLWAVIEASKNKPPLYIKIIIWTFFIFLATCVMLENSWPQAESLSYLASIGLVTGHMLNIRHCKKCKTF